MNIAMNNKAIAAFILLVSLLLLNSGVSDGSTNDVQCLRSLKESVKDPNSYLTSWIFNNNTEGFICKFIGVDCWHPDENRVLNIRLSALALEGRFPDGLGNCSSLTGLDLSHNELSGPIPSNICAMLPYLTSLDLSSNKFTGEIPFNLSDCKYLNVLKFNNNQLTGQIPPQLGNLERLKQFSVANNHLTGPVPTFANHAFPPDTYANNSGLCGKPLNACKGHKRIALGI